MECCKGKYTYKELCQECRVLWSQDATPEERLNILKSLRDEAVESTWYQSALKSVKVKLRIVK